MKHIFIVNPVSGRSDASQVLVPRIIQTAQAAGVDYQIELTRAPHHATQLARQYAWQDGESRIYACGGDGTLNEVLAGAWDSPRAQVGCVPCGSGNDFVRNFSDPEAFLDIDAQLRGDSAAIDLVRTDRVWRLPSVPRAWTPRWLRYPQVPASASLRRPDGL